MLPNLKILELQFLVTVDNELSCHMTLEGFQGEKSSLTYQCSISSEKTKVNQFARLCRIIYSSLINNNYKIKNDGNNNFRSFD